MTPIRLMMLSLLSAGFITTNMPAATISVPDDYPTIQEAIDAASNGDEIVVGPGTYVGDGYNVVDMDGKSVVLRSEQGPEVTVIDGELSRRVILCNSGETNETVIDGFTITRGQAIGGPGDAPGSTGNGKIGDGSGVYCQGSSSPTFRNCVISDCQAWSGGGMYFYQGCAPIIEDCQLIDNDAQYDGGGMSMRNCSAGPRLLRVMFINNGSRNGGGLHVGDGSNIDIDDSTFIGNRADLYPDAGVTGSGGGMRIYYSSADLKNCVFYDNMAGGPGGGSGGGIEKYGSGTVIVRYSVLCRNIPNDTSGSVSVQDSRVCDPACVADVNRDGEVNGADIGLLLGTWGSCVP